MALTRVVYTDTVLEISSSLVASAPLSLSTVQNATFTINVPRENVNVFGKQGTVDRPQLTATDATVEFSFIPELSASASTTLTGSDIGALLGESKKGNPTRVTYIQVAGVGKLTECLINSLGIEGAVGALPTMTMGFTGVQNAVPTATNLVSYASNMTLIQPKNISLSSLLLPTTDSCAQSVSLSWDMPVEKIVCLGADPALASTTNVFGNPPGTASITVESLSEQIPTDQASMTYALTFGSYVFTLGGARIDSKTNSLAIGDLFGTFNYVLGGTADGMTVA